MRISDWSSDVCSCDLLSLDPRVIGFIALDGIFSTAAGFALTSRVNEFDLTDGSGRGILVATDSLYLNLNTVNTGRINYVHAKIIYRLKNVTLQEYVVIEIGERLVGKECVSRCRSRW